MKMAVVMNTNAGALVGVAHDQMGQRIQQLFATAGADTQLVMTTGPDLAETIARFRHSDVQAVIVAGGDGSVTTAAKALAGSDKALGVLPMGTLNLFARDLQVPLDLEQAVLALAGGQIQKVDTAEVNGKLFLCNSVMGLMPSLVDARESVRGMSLPQRLWDIAIAVIRMVRRYPRLTVSVDMGKGPLTIAVRTLAVSCNPYEEKFGVLPMRRRLDTGRLALYHAGHPSRLRMLWLLISLGLGRWKTSESVSEWMSPQLTIAGRGKSIRVVNDGELLTLSLPLHYRIHPKELAVLAPARHEPVQA